MNDNEAANAAPAGWLLRLCETTGWKQFVFPSRFTWEAHPAAGSCPSRPLPAGSPAHKRTLSPLNDKQLRDAEAVKCIRQVQGSLPNRCGHGSALRGHAHSWGEYTQNVDNGLGGSGRAGGGGGAPHSAPSPAAPLSQPSHHTGTGSSSTKTDGSASKPGLPKLTHYSELLEEQENAFQPQNPSRKKPQTGKQDWEGVCMVRREEIPSS